MKPVNGVEHAVQICLIHDPYQQPRGMLITCLNTGIRDVGNDAWIQLTLYYNAIDRRRAETQKMR